MSIKLKAQNITKMYTPIELISTGIDKYGHGGGGGVTDHGQLHGLGDNDHPQYLLSSRSTQFIPVGNSTQYQYMSNSSLSLGTDIGFYSSNSSDLVALSNSTLFALSNHTHTSVNSYLTTAAASDHSHGSVMVTSISGTELGVSSASTGLSLFVPNYITTYNPGISMVGVGNGVGSNTGWIDRYNGGIRLGDGNGISFGWSDSTANPGIITAKMEYPDQVGILGIWDGASSLQTNSSMQFANSNGLSFGFNGSTMTGSYTVPGNTIFSNSNNVEFGLNGSTVTAIALFDQSNQTGHIINEVQGMSVGSGDLSEISFNYYGDNGSISSGTLYIGAGSGITLVQTSNSLFFVGNDSTVSNSLNLNIGGNVSGSTINVSLGTVLIAGGNNITLSQSGNSITISGPIVGGVQTGISGIGASDTVYSSGTVIWSAANTNLTIGSYKSSDSQYVRLSVGNYLTTAAGLSHTHGSNVSTLSTTGTDIKFTSASNGLTMGVPAFGTGYLPVVSSANFAKTGFTTQSTAGSDVVGTLNTLGLALGIPKYLTTAVTGSHTHSDYVGLATTAITGGFMTANSSQLMLNVPIGSLYFQDSNGVTWGGSTNGNTTTITAMVTGGGTGGGGGAALQGSGTYTQNSGTIVFQTGNGLTFGLTNNVMTGSHNAFTNTNQFSANLMPLAYSSGFQTATLASYLLPLANSTQWATSVLSNSLMPIAYSSGFQTSTLANTFAQKVSSSQWATSYLAGSLLPLANSTQWATSYLATKFLTTAAYSTHTHGTPTIALTALSGTLSSVSNGFTISISAPASSNFVNTSQTGSVYFQNIAGFSWTSSVSSNSTSIYLKTI